MYRIHYKGWARNRDEWLAEADVLKPTPENLAQMEADIAAETDAAARRTRKSSTTSTASTDKGTRKRKRHDDADDDDDGASQHDDPLVNPFTLPPSVKKALLADQELHSHKPKKDAPQNNPSVDDILSAFATAHASNEQHCIAEQCLRVYFERALPVYLLYQSEIDLFQKNKLNVPNVQFYGLDHLLRFFVKLPLLLSSASDILIPSFQLFIDFVAENYIVKH